MQAELTTTPEPIRLEWPRSAGGEQLSASQGDAPAHEARRRVDEDLSGVLAGNFRLEQRLGTGGLGSVWRAEHPEIGSQVAVKVLHADVTHAFEAARRFVREAQAVNRIHCSRVVRIFDFGRMQGEGGREYAVMELLRGETLGARLRRGPVPWSEAREIGRQLLEAMDAAHRAGVVHRDLKPENVHLGPDSDAPDVKVLDFGIAKLLDTDDADPEMTCAGFCVGTPAYAAPEQLTGGTILPATDVYGCGELLYEMLAGRPPFTGSIKQVVKSKLAEEPDPIATLVPGLHPEVAVLIDAMLAMEPEDRPTVAQALEVLQRSDADIVQPVVVTPPGIAPPLPLDAMDTIPGGDALHLLDGEDLFHNVVPWGTESDRADAEVVIPPPIPRRRRPRVLIPCCVTAGVAVAVVAGWLAFSLTSGPASASAPTPRPSQRQSVAQRQSAQTPRAPRPLVEPLKVHEPAPREQNAARPVPRTHAVTFVSRPAGAVVRVEGRRAGQTPLVLNLPPSASPLEVTFHRKGYRRARRFVPVDGPRTVAATLARDARDTSHVDWIDPF